MTVSLMIIIVIIIIIIVDIFEQSRICFSSRKLWFVSFICTTDSIYFLRVTQNVAGKVENSNSNPRKWLDEGHRPERVNTGKPKWIVQTAPRMIEK